ALTARRRAPVASLRMAPSASASRPPPELSNPTMIVGDMDSLSVRAELRVQTTLARASHWSIAAWPDVAGRDGQGARRGRIRRTVGCIRHRDVDGHGVLERPGRQRAALALPLVDAVVHR